ncbi:sulfurtransferase TusA family protein [Nocardioides guangzhouensis]|uniref:Sulfurtransferase TusA family protein n=1 Tax=Nocardioides guangzhouensis TaxID=2497878 RepID=A0A4Q4ZCD6_9ACTN|nr:sulfurtransferase TusA family protein [Nocardioides guangzhouensis]RYP85643.1 sulfurtransferase TusA family protein [Nocardioides guangzhouensis]
MSDQPGRGEPEETVEVDCRDLRCPQPVIELARVSGGLADGTVLAVLATDPAAATDIPAWCRMRGHEFLGSEMTGRGVQRFLVRLGHRPAI